VEALRGLRFRRIPQVAILQPDELGALGETLRRDAIERLGRARLERFRRLTSAQDDFQALAGLLPAAAATDVSASSASEQIGGAYDYRQNRIVLVDRVVQTRRELQLVLAHELTHALEDQHFALHIATSRGAAQGAQARRALFEGTATFLASLYDGRYLHNVLPVGLRIAGQRSVFTAGGSTPFAIKADTIFDYVDGPLFVQSLRRQASGSWRLVNRALRAPPGRTEQILHPATWPPARGTVNLKLGLGELLRPDLEPAGGGVAGEEDALAVFTSGGPEQVAAAAAAGWRGGRFELWRPVSGSCEDVCSDEYVGVLALRLRTRADVAQVDDAFFDYALLGRLGQRLAPRTWSFGDGGFTALARGRRSVAIVFAPDARLAHEAGAAAARAAAAGGAPDNRQRSR
jgi:hypothetical protein